MYALFGAYATSVRAVELFGSIGVQGLSRAELEVVARSSQRRRQDFAAGRACAHAATSAWGFDSQSLLPDDHGVPQWPGGISGSITHTHGYALAATLWQLTVICDSHNYAIGVGRLASVGVDAEHIDSVGADVYDMIFTALERDSLARLHGPERQWAATAMFVAKEAFYKAQYPLTVEWIGFEEANVTVESSRLRLAWSETPSSRLIGPGPWLGGLARRGDAAVAAFVLSQ